MKTYKKIDKANDIISFIQFSKLSSMVGLCLAIVLGLIK